MIVFVGQVGTDMLDRRAFQEIDYRRMYGSVAKWAVQIDRVDRIPEYIAHAHRLAREDIEKVAEPKARMLALEQKRAAYLGLVGEIAARAAAFSDPDAIVRTMVELVQERFGYHHVCVCFYDPLRNELEQRAAAGPNAPSRACCARRP